MQIVFYSLTLDFPKKFAKFESKNSKITKNFMLNIIQITPE